MPPASTTAQADANLIRLCADTAQLHAQYQASADVPRGRKRRLSDAVDNRLRRIAATPATTPAGRAAYAAMARTISAGFLRDDVGGMDELREAYDWVESQTAAIQAGLRSPEDGIALWRYRRGRPRLPEDASAWTVAARAAALGYDPLGQP